MRPQAATCRGIADLPCWAAEVLSMGGRQPLEAGVHPTADLPRASWFPELKGYRSTETGTYVRDPLDEQPKISEADDELS